MNKLIAIVILSCAVAIALPQLMLKQATQQATAPSMKNTNATPSTSEVAFASSSSSEVRLKPDVRGHYIADFKMNGRVVTALVDTGASTVAINKSTARRLGLNITANDFIYEANTANGKTKMAIAKIREIQIGRVIVRDVEAAVLEDKALDGTLLGMSFLKRLDGFTVTDGDLILKQ